MNKGIEFVCELTVYGNYKPVDELVRCKDCAKRYTRFCPDVDSPIRADDWFCADGERRTDDA